jgi:hypothetical protein
MNGEDRFILHCVLCIQNKHGVWRRYTKLSLSASVYPRAIGEIFRGPTSTISRLSSLL